MINARKTNAARIGGLTLIELMITVAIVAILAAIAYPSYQNQIRQSRRAEAKTALLEIQVAQEKRFLASSSYVTTTAGISNSWASNGLGLNTSTPHGYYTLTIESGATSTSYTAKATRAGSQSGDSCGDFTLSSTGAKTPTTAGCW